MSTPKLWDRLHSDSSVSIVVPEGIEPIDALRILLQEEYGGEELFSADNPVVIDAAKGLRIEAWRKCSAQQARDYGADEDSAKS